MAEADRKPHRTRARWAWLLLACTVAPCAAQTPRPAFTLPDLDGAPQSIAQYDGRVVVLNFWATWCTPCLKEIPEFAHLQDEYGAHGVQFLGVAIEAGPAGARELGARLGMNYPSLYGEDAAMQIAAAYGNDIGALPYTAVIDRAGSIVYTRKGIVDIAELERLLGTLVH